MNIFKAIPKLFSRHKFIFAVGFAIVLLSIFFALRFVTSNSSEKRYVLAAVQKGVITNSVSGSGQVSAQEAQDIKARASGQIVYLNVKPGDNVKRGKLLA